MARSFEARGERFSVQFRSPGLCLRVASALARSGLPARRLEFTEALLIWDDASALATLHELRALGVRIALDDFGTGYSSLGYLQRFPFDQIEIDRSFVRDLMANEGAALIVKAAVAIARRPTHDENGGRGRDGLAARGTSSPRM